MTYASECDIIFRKEMPVRSFWSDSKNEMWGLVYGWSFTETCEYLEAEIDTTIDSLMNKKGTHESYLQHNSYEIQEDAVVFKSKHGEYRIFKTNIQQQLQSLGRSTAAC